jgi:hypothetical protein
MLGLDKLNVCKASKCCAEVHLKKNNLFSDSEFSLPYISQVSCTVSLDP